MVKNLCLRLASLVLVLSILLPVNSLVKQSSSNWTAPASAAVLSGSPLPPPTPPGPSFLALSGSPLPPPTPPGPSNLAVSGSPLPPPTPPGPSLVALSGSPLPPPTPPGPSFSA